MRSRCDFPEVGWFCDCRSGRLPRCFGSSRCSQRYRAWHSGNSQDVARRHRELEVLIDPSQSSEHGLTDAPDGLAPAEVFLYALADHLTQYVALVPGCAPVNRAAPATRVVARHMRHDVAVAACVNEVLGVVGLVRPHRLGLRAGNAIEHRQCRRSFIRAVGGRHHRTDDQPRSVLHQYVPLVAKNRRRVEALPEQPRIRIGAALVRVVTARLALPVGLGVAPRSRRRLVVAAILGPEALVARPGLDQSHRPRSAPWTAIPWCRPVA